MIDEKEVQQMQQRGVRAKQLLNDPMIQDALDDISRILYERIKNTSYNESDIREHCYMMLKASDNFVSMFKRHINTGKAAEERLSGLKRIVRRVQEI